MQLGWGGLGSSVGMLSEEDYVSADNLVVW